MQRPHILFIHGAWHGAWCWDSVRAILDGDGWQTSAIDLPSVHSPDKSSLGMYADSDAVAEAIQSNEGNVVVVAHSYGGVPATQGAGLPNVQHIVYVSAFVPDVGESLLTSAGGVAPDWWRREEDLLFPGDGMQAAIDLFFADINAEQASLYASRLQPMSYQAIMDPVTTTAWSDRSTTYIVADDDAGFPSTFQEHFASLANSTIHHVATGHSPFFTQPARIANIIAHAAENDRTITCHG